MALKNGLIIFAREPLPGKVKTRLAAAIGDSAAVDAYKTMLRCVLENCRSLSDTEIVVYWACEEDKLPYLAERYNCSSKKQSEGDLGQRMRVAFEEMFADGCDLCCIIGSDSPDLPVAYIEEAFGLLAVNLADTVFGPSRDGGYYLLGLSRLWPQLFTDINWSTPQTLQESLAAAEKAGATTVLLPEWYDIDTEDDLKKYLERSKIQIQAQVGFK